MYGTMKNHESQLNARDCSNHAVNLSYNNGLTVVDDSDPLLVNVVLQVDFKNIIGCKFFTTQRKDAKIKNNNKKKNNALSYSKSTEFTDSASTTTLEEPFVTPPSAPESPSQDDENIAYTLEIIAIYFPIISCCSIICGSRQGYERKIYTIHFDKNEVCRNFASMIDIIVSNNEYYKMISANNNNTVTTLNLNINMNIRKRKYIIIVNPKSGTGNSENVWKRQVMPLLEDAKIEIDLLMTTSATDAPNYIQYYQELDTTIEAIMCIGGDGTLNDVINAVIRRDDAFKCMKSITFIPIPSGTGNGLAKSISYESSLPCTPESMTFIALKGSKKSVDIADVTFSDNSRRQAFLMLGWGLIADVDLLSETMRMLGEARLYYAGVYNILRRKLYPAKLSIITRNSKDIEEGKGTTTTRAERSTSDVSLLELPSLNEPFIVKDNENYTSEVLHEGLFILIWVVQTSHCAMTMFSGPTCRLGQGSFVVYWIEDQMSRAGMLQLLLQIDNGEHEHNPLVKKRNCLAYRIEPHTNGSLFTLDGEHTPEGAMQACISSNSIQTMSI